MFLRPREMSKGFLILLRVSESSCCFIMTGFVRSGRGRDRVHSYSHRQRLICSVLFPEARYRVPCYSHHLRLNQASINPRRSVEQPLQKVLLQRERSWSQERPAGEGRSYSPLRRVIVAEVNKRQDFSIEVRKSRGQLRGFPGRSEESLLGDLATHPRYQHYRELLLFSVDYLTDRYVRRVYICCLLSTYHIS